MSAPLKILQLTVEASPQKIQSSVSENQSTYLINRFILLARIDFVSSYKEEKAPEG
jgi:hypothetical protein